MGVYCGGVHIEFLPTKRVQDTFYKRKNVTEPMRIKVNKLGAIADGEIDLRTNLTILTGLNNSGKTTMSYIAYSILNQTIDFPDLVIEGLERSMFEGERLLEMDIFDLYRSNSKYIQKIVTDQSDTKIRKEYPSYFSTDSSLKLSFDSSWVRNNLYSQYIEYPVDIISTNDETITLVFFLKKIQIC